MGQSLQTSVRPHKDNSVIIPQMCPCRGPYELRPREWQPSSLSMTGHSQKKKARSPALASVPLHREASDSRPAAAGCQGDSMPRVSDV